jgi:peptidyl-prolyl cis-trans isomerase A (cyclophilin A)
MKRRGFIGAGLALVATAVAACSKKPEQAEAPAPVAEKPKAPPAPPQPETVTVQLTTTKGDIEIVLEAKKAPLTTANFLHYLDAGKIVGANFWRAAHSGPSGFIQASIQGPTFPPIAHESTKMTGLSHTNGAISMSRFAPGTATGDFILCVGDNTYMDAGREGSDDKLGYAAFGHVIKGMDVVKAILKGKIDSHTREGGWAGQMLAAPIEITGAKRIGETFADKPDAGSSESASA